LRFVPDTTCRVYLNFVVVSSRRHSKLRLYAEILSEANIRTAEGGGATRVSQGEKHKSRAQMHRYFDCAVAYAPAALKMTRGKG